MYNCMFVLILWASFYSTRAVETKRYKFYKKKRKKIINPRIMSDGIVHNSPRIRNEFEPNLKILVDIRFKFVFDIV